jgi:hypothetical protein
MDSAILIAAIALIVIYRQFQTRAISTRGLVILPLALLVLGANGLAQTPPKGALAIGALALEAAIGIGLGALRGRSVLVWQDTGGTWWRRGTRTTAALWVGTIAVRIGVIVGARLLGDHDATSSGSIELALGVSLAAQFAVIALRCGLVDLAPSLRPRSNPPTD